MSVSPAHWIQVCALVNTALCWPKRKVFVVVLRDLIFLTNLQFVEEVTLCAVEREMRNTVSKRNVQTSVMEKNTSGAKNL